MGSLSRKQRAITRRHIYGQTNPEIAQAHSIGAENAASHVSLGMGRLRSYVDDAEGEFGVPKRGAEAGNASGRLGGAGKPTAESRPSGSSQKTTRLERQQPQGNRLSGGGRLSGEGGGSGRLGGGSERRSGGGRGRPRGGSGSGNGRLG